MREAKITNNSSSALTFTLYHDLYCKRSRDCSCTLVKDRASTYNATGVDHVATKDSASRVPISVTLAPKGQPGSSAQVSEAIENIPQFKTAKKMKLVSIQVIKPAPAPPPAPAPVLLPEPDKESDVVEEELVAEEDVEQTQVKKTKKSRGKKAATTGDN